MLERILTLLRTVGQVAMSVQERRAQIRSDMHAGPWEYATGETPAIDVP